MCAHLQHKEVSLLKSCHCFGCQFWLAKCPHVCGLMKYPDPNAAIAVLFSAGLAVR